MNLCRDHRKLQAATNSRFKTENCRQKAAHSWQESVMQRFMTVAEIYVKVNRIKCLHFSFLLNTFFFLNITYSKLNTWSPWLFYLMRRCICISYHHLLAAYFSPVSPFPDVPSPLNWEGRNSCLPWSWLWSISHKTHTHTRRVRIDHAE